MENQQTTDQPAEQPEQPKLSGQARKEARRAAYEARLAAEKERQEHFAKPERIKSEVSDFPVFKAGEVLPLKYHIHSDILGSIISRRHALGKTVSPEEKAFIKSEMKLLLKKYVSHYDYRLAAVLKRQRYSLNGEIAGQMKEKDVASFVRLLRLAEKRRAEKAAASEGGAS